MKRRTARKILKKIHQENGYLDKIPYSMYQIDRACYRLFKESKEACEKFNREHSGVVARPVVMLTKKTIGNVSKFAHDKVNAAYYETVRFETDV